MYFDWDDAKNAKLRAERGIGFEDIVFHIERRDVLDLLEHPNPDRYAGQRIFVVRREDYVDLAWPVRSVRAAGSRVVRRSHDDLARCPKTAVRWAAGLRRQYWRRHAFREELARACESLGVFVPA